MAEDTDPLGSVRPPSRRRPRRSDVVTYRVRVDLADTKPPLWRRLELASDLFLDDVHEVLQVAFGWTDSHLHRFASGPRYYGPETEYYLGPFEAGDPDLGVPEHEVRLDEVLVDVGDRMFYVYDFGDDWQHTIKLEAVLPRGAAAPRAVCTAGRRAGPPEDCGGVYGFELIAAATDSTRPDHTEAVAELARFYGDEIDPENLALSPFDRDAINRALAGLGFDGVSGRAGGERPDQRTVGEVPEKRTASEVPEPLADLLAAVRTAPARRRLRQLISGAQLDEPVSIDDATAARMVGAYTWLLNRVGGDGIKLTGSGYLPPAHVEAAVDELGLGEEWIGKGNREHLTMPVLHLRETAQRMGLARKYRGRLVLTTRGRALREDAVALWWHVAEHLPPRSRDDSETQAGLLTLLLVAAQAPDDLHATVAELLTAIGWRGGDGTPVTATMAAHAALDTTAVLRRVGAFPRAYSGGARERPTAQGVAFARAAVQTWPHPG